MVRKTAILSKAQAVAALGLPETAVPLWVAAASYEERLAPLLEALGREREAAVHRISAASCYHKAGDFSRAANLYRAALAGPLLQDTRQEVERILADCLAELTDATIDSVL
jgi:tetratricopeptide (TPR) repeat protein